MVDRDYEVKKKQHEMINSLIDFLGDTLGDKRLNCISKLSQLQNRIMELVVDDLGNTDPIMSDELITVTNAYIESINSIFRSYGKEEI